MIAGKKEMAPSMKAGITLWRHPVSLERFSLIELLVVIAIMGILMSVLLPALNKARGNAYDAVCKGKLKQIGVAAMEYACDFDGWVPVSMVPISVAPPLILSWTGQLADYLRSPRYGSPWTFEVYACPSGPKELKDLSPWTYGNGSGIYGAYNSSYGWNQHMGFQAVYPRQKIDKCTTADFLVADAVLFPNNAGIDGTTYQMAFRHNSRTNVTFADGRVEGFTANEINAKVSANSFKWLP